MNTTRTTELAVPEGLLPTTEQILPGITLDTVTQLTEAGWSRVGLLVPLITRAGKLLVLRHNESDKSDDGMLGPLGETSKAASFHDIEQPMETLDRAVREELGVKEPAQLGLFMRTGGGWFTHAWPRGIGYPGEYSCGISPAVYVPPKAEQSLLSRPIGNEEINGLEAMAPEAILDMPESQLRPGFRDWTVRFLETGFLEWPTEESRHRLGFATLYRTLLPDLDLKTVA